VDKGPSLQNMLIQKEVITHDIYPETGAVYSPGLYLQQISHGLKMSFRVQEAGN
jgi:hypothetical protein